MAAREKKATENSASERPLGRPFKKGVSGNPGGRPKAVKELQERARVSVPAAFGFAESLLADDEADPRVRLDAAKFLTAYGIGAPPKEPPKDDGEDLTDEQLEQEVAQLMAARGNGTPSRPH